MNYVLQGISDPGNFSVLHSSTHVPPLNLKFSMPDTRLSDVLILQMNNVLLEEMGGRPVRVRPIPYAQGEPFPGAGNMGEPEKEKGDTTELLQMLKSASQERKVAHSSFTELQVDTSGGRAHKSRRTQLLQVAGGQRELSGSLTGRSWRTTLQGVALCGGMVILGLVVAVGLRRSRR